MNNLFSQVAQNAIFVLEFAGIVLAFFVIAYLVEKVTKKKNGDTEKILSTRKMVAIGMLGAIATILFLFEFPMPFAPAMMYKFDFSELPALIGAFAYGPVAGVMIEFIKILLKLFIKSTTTAFVGDLANFVIGCSLVVPAAIIYQIKKTKPMALIACAVGTILITIIGTSFNAVYLIPTFSKMFGMPLDAIIGAGTAINPKITNITTFVIFAVAPLNLIKGTADSIITILIYKHISPLLKKTN